MPVPALLLGLLSWTVEAPPEPEPWRPDVFLETPDRCDATAVAQAASGGFELEEGLVPGRVGEPLARPLDAHTRGRLALLRSAAACDHASVPGLLGAFDVYQLSRLGVYDAAARDDDPALLELWAAAQARLRGGLLDQMTSLGVEALVLDAIDLRLAEVDGAERASLAEGVRTLAQRRPSASLVGEAWHGWLLGARMGSPRCGKLIRDKMTEIEQARHHPDPLAAVRAVDEDLSWWRLWLDPAQHCPSGTAAVAADYLETNRQAEERIAALLADL